MNNKSSFGKLIVSKYNDFYITFHNLQLILVRGCGNKIDIDHNVSILVIDGNNNKVEIGNEGHVHKVKFNGNNNDLIIHSINSFNELIDNGDGNDIYKIPNENRSESQNSNLDNYSENSSENGGEERFNLLNDSGFEEDFSDNERYENHRNILNRLGPNVINPVINRFLLERNDLRNRNNQSDSDSESESDSEKNSYNLIDVTFNNISKGVKDGNEKCVICYENFKKKEPVKMTTCFHLFHFNCIKEWIKTKKEQIDPPDCPICRREL